MPADKNDENRPINNGSFICIHTSSRCMLDMGHTPPIDLNM